MGTNDLKGAYCDALELIIIVPPIGIAWLSP
jgi:hypothetical protein